MQFNWKDGPQVNQSHYNCHWPFFVFITSQFNVAIKLDVTKAGKHLSTCVIDRSITHRPNRESELTRGDAVWFLSYGGPLGQYLISCTLSGATYDSNSSWHCSPSTGPPGAAASAVLFVLHHWTEEQVEFGWMCALRAGTSAQLSSDRTWQMRI